MSAPCPSEEPRKCPHDVPPSGKNEDILSLDEGQDDHPGVVVGAAPVAPPRRKGHARSASHAGVLVHRDPKPEVAGHIGSSSLKENGPYAQGHHRTMSHGQVTEGRGHARMGSRTEFILPEGHEEREKERRKRSTVKGSRPGSASYSKGHKRQQSRTDSVYSIREKKKPFRQKLIFWKNYKLDGGARLVVPNHIVSQNISNSDHPNYSYAKNKIYTRKYTILTFLPKNLFEQFHRFANLYFLFIVLLNFVPSVSAFAPMLSTLPLIFVLGVTAIKDIYEDYGRYVSDRDINNSTCRVYDGLEKRYVQKKWEDVRVGDILHLSCDEIIPADMVILNVSDGQGVCYIESSNLDGEINLKQRQCSKGIGNGDDFNVSQLNCMLEVGPPSTKMDHFVGSFSSPSGERTSVTKDNFIPRDCVIKNTDFVEGIVVYAGRETKALLNNGGPRYKRSKLERNMNREVLWSVVILFIICALSATGAGFWQRDYYNEDDLTSVPFIVPDPNGDDPIDSPSWVAFTNFWSFIIIYQVMIPISLYVTIEIIKLMQVYHIQCDDNFYDPKIGKGLRCRALNINEELGQVQYIFADKTGTLTENNMVFQRCSLNGVDYAHEVIEKDNTKDIARDSFITNSDLLEEVRSIEMHSDPHGRIHSSTSLSTRESLQRITDFFITLAACNTVVVSKHQHHDTMTATGVVIPREPEPESKKGSRNPSLSLPFNLPSLHHPGRKIRSLLPSSRPLSPIAASPSCTPPVTPQESPRHSEINDTDVPQSQTNSFAPYAFVPPDAKNEILLSIPPLLDGGRIILEEGSEDEGSLQGLATPIELDIKPFYEAESPDELALVDAAYTYGFRLIRRNINSILLMLPGSGVCEFEVLHVLPFDSNRKRMSIIVRHPETGVRTLFCKGADSAILDNLNPTSDPTVSAERSALRQHLDTYAKLGLRVLCVAKRALSDAVYEAWALKYNKAANALADRETKLYNVYCEIERYLYLLGATGVEDCLQDGVPETISALKEAGIIIYVLTGDKQETAINIAYSCSLFSIDMEVLKLNGRNLEETRQLLTSFLLSAKTQDEQWEATFRSAEYSAKGEDEVWASSRNSRLTKPKPRGLVVDGLTLVIILDARTNLKTPFLELAQRCNTVLCCRATPLQKALIVRNVKDKLKVLTLSVGDGANDVSMIQTADVGVGISGVEGRQAVMASDFSISRFKHLERLLLVHGHWSYDRLSRVILYFFYKNAAVVFILMWFQFYCGFSGSSVMEQLFLTMFTLLFTSIPPVLSGIYNKDAPEDVLSSQPRLYAMGRLSQVYKPISFWINILDALYQSLAILFVSVLAYKYSETGFYELGMTITHTLLITQLLHLAIETTSWTLIELTGMAVSYLLFILFSVAYTVFGNGYFFKVPSQRGEFEHMMASPTHWFTLFLATVLALLPRFVCRVLRNHFCPNKVVRAVIEYKARYKGIFPKSISKASSSSSIYRFTCPSETSRVDSMIDPMSSSVVTMTTLVSNQSGEANA